MSPISQTKPACIKTPTLTKGKSAGDAIAAKKEVCAAEGMLFIFSLPDAETKAYISYDPMFQGISGYQSDFTRIITKDMIEKMTEEGKKIDPDFYEIGGDYSDEDLSNFLYGYGECMEECDGGEIAKGTVLVHIYF